MDRQAKFLRWFLTFPSGHITSPIGTTGHSVQKVPSSNGCPFCATGLLTPLSKLHSSVFGDDTMKMSGQCSSNDYILMKFSNVLEVLP